MSLIHDALKKADQEKPGVGEESPLISSHPVIPDPKSPPKRIVILIVLLIGGLGMLVYSRFLRTARPAASPQPISIPSPTYGPVGEKQLESRALRAFEENRLAESREAWDKLILLRPTDATLYNNLGLVLKKLRKHKEAAAAYNQALALDEDYPEALNNRGVLSLADGNRAEAKADFERALALKKNYAPPHLHLALMFERERNFPQARLHYETFLKVAAAGEDSVRKKVQMKLDSLKAP